MSMLVFTVACFAPVMMLALAAQAAMWVERNRLQGEVYCVTRDAAGRMISRRVR